MEMSVPNLHVPLHKLSTSFLFSLISRHKSGQEDDAVDLILLLIVIIGKVSGNL